MAPSCWFIFAFIFAFLIVVIANGSAKLMHRAYISLQKKIRRSQSQPGGEGNHYGEGNKEDFLISLLAFLQERVNINALNRGQRKFPHRTGRTSFFEIKDELTLLGAPSSPLEVRIMSRACAKGATQDEETVNLHVHDGPSSRRNKSPAILDGPKVKLLGVRIPKDIVDEGILMSKDPEARVANVSLGPDCWKVYVDKVYCPTEKLWRRTGKISTIGQVLRKIVAWPISDVSLDEDTDENEE